MLLQRQLHHESFRTCPITGILPYAAGKTTTENAIIPVGANGKIDIVNNSATPADFTGDISGYFTSGTTGQLYHPLGATRLLDTRQTSPISADTTTTVDVPASITADNPTLVTNITVLNPTKGGYLRAQPSTDPATGTATLNFTAGQTGGNLALVNTATGNALTIGNSSSGSVEVIVDVNGYFQ